MDAETKGTVGRKSYEIKDKRNVVQQVDELVSIGFSFRKACMGLGIPLLYYSRWKKLVEKVDAINSGKEFVPYNTKGTSCKIHPGRASVLVQVKRQLQQFTIQLREQGVQVTNRMVLQEAARLLPDFKDKSRQLLYEIHQSHVPLCNTHFANTFHGKQGRCKGLHSCDEVEVCSLVTKIQDMDLCHDLSLDLLPFQRFLELLPFFFR